MKTKPARIPPTLNIALRLPRSKRLVMTYDMKTLSFLSSPTLRASTTTTFTSSSHAGRWTMPCVGPTTAGPALWPKVWDCWQGGLRPGLRG
jgi:hypothetical protein